MINPKELQIGNYVNSHNGYAKVLGILCDSIETDIHCGILDDFDPIPITPELLDKIEGFECVRGFWKYKDCEYFFILRDGIVELYAMIDCIIHLIPHHVIKHLHQLQNLYYSLTNQELTFKTTTHE